MDLWDSPTKLLMIPCYTYLHHQSWWNSIISRWRGGLGCDPLIPASLILLNGLLVKLILNFCQSTGRGLLPSTIAGPVHHLARLGGPFLGALGAGAQLPKRVRAPNFLGFSNGSNASGSKHLKSFCFCLSPGMRILTAKTFLKILTRC